MVRKGFDIPEYELDRAKQLAGEQGISLSAYLRQSVIDRNNGIAPTVNVDAAADRLHATVDRLEREMGQLRLDLLKQDEIRSKAAMELHERAVAENRELMAKAIATLGQHIASILNPSASPAARKPRASSDPAGPYLHPESRT